MKILSTAGRWIASHPWPVAGLAVIVAIVAVILLSVSMAAEDAPAVATGDLYQDLIEHEETLDDVRPEPSVPSVLETPVVAVPVPELYMAAVDRLLIEKIGVDAPFSTKRVDSNGVMESPDGPEDVAWYDFTSKPGLGGNAVFSGHVDYINYGAAVFYDLEDLVEGDQIDVVLEDGTLLQYAVTAIFSYGLDEIPMAEVLAQTSIDTVTLITCDGSFANGGYSHRLVVRATRTAVITPAT